MSHLFRVTPEDAQLLANFAGLNTTVLPIIRPELFRDVGKNREKIMHPCCDIQMPLLYSI